MSDLTLAIDPGPSKCGWVLMDNTLITVVSFGWDAIDLFKFKSDWRPDKFRDILIEFPDSVFKSVGHSIIQTAAVCGELKQIFRGQSINNPRYIGRKAVTSWIKEQPDSSGAKPFKNNDSGVVAYCKSRGFKVSGHAWQALGMYLYYDNIGK